MNVLDPMMQRLLGLSSSVPEDLESLSIEELEVIHAIKLRQLVLTKRIGKVAGFVGSLAAGRFLLPRAKWGP